jgi:hypothetical protein
MNKGLIKKIVLGIYLFQVLAFALLIISQFLNYEKSLWIITAYNEALELHGISDAIFVIYVYLIFYSSLIFVPYWIFTFIYDDIYISKISKKLLDEHNEIEIYAYKGFVLIISIWFCFSFFFFSEPIKQFLKYIPTETWNGWLLMIWFGITFIALVSFSLIRKKHKIIKKLLDKE